MSTLEARRDPAHCEWCGGIVSNSRVKGDTKDPIRAGAHSACAQFYHTECAGEWERYYIATRFQEPTDEMARVRLEESNASHG